MIVAEAGIIAFTFRRGRILHLFFFFFWRINQSVVDYPVSCHLFLCVNLEQDLVGKPIICLALWVNDVIPSFNPDPDRYYERELHSKWRRFCFVLGTKRKWWVYQGIYKSQRILVKANMVIIIVILFNLFNLGLWGQATVGPKIIQDRQKSPLTNIQTKNKRNI